MQGAVGSFRASAFPLPSTGYFLMGGLPALDCPCLLSQALHETTYILQALPYAYQKACQVRKGKNKERLSVRCVILCFLLFSHNDNTSEP